MHNLQSNGFTYMFMGNVMVLELLYNTLQVITVSCCLFSSILLLYEIDLPSSTDLSLCVTLRCFHIAIQVYKILHNLLPSYLNDTFHYAVDITGCAS